MTCRKSSSRTALRRAAILLLPCGGKTSPWSEGSSALTRSLAWWPLFNRIRTVTLTQSQITMSEHDQSNVTVEASPKASLIMIETEFSFGVLIESLDHPTDVCKLNQLFQTEIIEFPGKVIFELLLSIRFGDGTLTQKPAANRQVSASVAAAEHFDPGELLYKRPLRAIPPCNPLPGFGWQFLQNLSRLHCRNALFEGRRLLGSALSAIRRRRWIALILINQSGKTESQRRTHCSNMWHFQSNQAVEQRWLVPIAGIYYNRPKGDLRLKGPIDQLQTDFTFSLKQNRFWHMRLFPPDLVLDPTVRQVQACSYRPVKNAINIMSSHKEPGNYQPCPTFRCIAARRLRKLCPFWQSQCHQGSKPHFRYMRGIACAQFEFGPSAAGPIRFE